MFLPLLAVTARLASQELLRPACHAEADAKVGGKRRRRRLPPPPPPPPPASTGVSRGAARCRPPPPKKVITLKRRADEVGKQDRHAGRHRIPERQRQDRDERQVRQAKVLIASRDHLERQSPRSRSFASRATPTTPARTRASTNTKLSTQRAQSIADYLTKRSGASTRIASSSRRGTDRRANPLAPNEHAKAKEHMALNRYTA